jgi:hypothetical protein
MPLKWIQERVKRLVGLGRESVATAYFRDARTLCIHTLVRGEKLYWYGIFLPFHNCVYCNMLTDLCSIHGLRSYALQMPENDPRVIPTPAPAITEV